MTQDTTATTTSTTARGFEREACTRCGGSGHYSYCQMYGTTCFKCAGQRFVLTKRGAAAAAYCETLRSKPHGEVKAGDKIRWNGKTCTVLETRNSVQEGMSGTNGVMKPYRREGIDIMTNLVQLVCCDPAKLVRMAQSAEDKARTLALALAYEDTLTKAGTPRKAR